MARRGLAWGDSSIEDYALSMLRAVYYLWMGRRVVGLVLGLVVALFVVARERLTAPDATAQAGPGQTAATAIGQHAHDGDTLTVRVGSEEERVRVFGVDAPERGQPFASAARKRAAELVEGQPVTLTPIERDRLDRLVARVGVPQGDLAEILLAEGLVWHFDRYSDDEAYAAAERAARADRRGLWSDRKPQPPWEWRREHPRND